MAKRDTKFESRKVDDLIPYARNARTHSAEQINKLVSSIREFGFINPVIISEDGGILAGHGRVMAAQKMGLKEVPCVVETHLSDTQRRAYILADNRLALDAGWDEEMLRIEMEELQSLDFDMELTGFDDNELSEYMKEMDKESPSDNSDDEEVNVEEDGEPVTQDGDIWLLGEHRLICGDSTKADVIGRLMGDRKSNLMVTDPPYGVNYNPSTLRCRHVSNGRSGEVFNDDRDSWWEAYSLFSGNVAYIWHGNLHTGVIIDDARKCGFEPVCVIVWNKNHFALSRSDYHWKHEACLYCAKGNHNWQGARDQTTVWDIISGQFVAKDEGAWGHGTQKPIECMLRPILNNSTEGEWIYDPFCGSGTTVIACENSGRKCLAVEIAPKYCDAIIRRWEWVTGGKAILEESGQLFDDLEQSREEC